MVLKYISVRINFFIYFLHQSLSLTILYYHSSHLYIKLVIYLALHALIHGLHELLNHVFNILNTFAVIHLLLKALSKVSDLWVFTHSQIIRRSYPFLILYLFKNFKNEANHSIIQCFFSKFSWTYIVPK